MQSINLCAMLLCAVMCNACALSAPDKAASPAESTPVTLPRANPPLFAVVDDTCPMGQEGSRESPLLLMVLGTVLKPLVETAVPATVGWIYDRGVQALQTRNAKLQASSTTITTTVMYRVSDKQFEFGCIILARALRGKTLENGVDYLRQEFGSGAILEPGSPWFADIAEKRAEKLHITRVPEFYFELALGPVRSTPENDIQTLNALPGVLPKGKTTLTEAERDKYAQRSPRSMYRTIKPVRLDYFASGAERVNNNAKNVSIELHMDAMDIKGEWQPFYAKTYDLGKLRVNSSGINVESLGEDIFVPPALRWTADAYIDPVPVRISATLTETDDNIDLSRALEIAFKDAQTKKSTVDAVAKVVVDKLQEKIDERVGTAAPKK